MKDKRCILLVRVSTEYQSYDEQEKELYDVALRYGYSPEQIVPISEKESGRKLKEEERKGLNRMKEIIEQDGDIDCVFAWEISRIARRKKILFSILEYLTERKIQLIIKEPKIELLKFDGSIDEGAETIFTLYAQLAETEMRNKFSRFERAKRENYAKGKYMGGKFLRGYTVNSDGYWVVDESDDQAPLIRLIFQLYISGKYSLTELGKELQDRGYFTHLSITSLKGHLSHILKNESYRGIRATVYRHKSQEELENERKQLENSQKEKMAKGEAVRYEIIKTQKRVENNNIFPQLIDDETWEKAVERRKNNRKRSKPRDTIYLLTPLIHCSCNASYCVNSIDGTYECRTRHNAVEKGLTHNPGIAVDMIESIAWFVTLQELHKDMAMEKRDSKEKYESEINLLRQKIKLAEEEIANRVKKRQQLDDAYYLHDRYTQERYEELTKSMNNFIDAKNVDIHRFEASIRHYEQLINSEKTHNNLMNMITQNYDDIKGGTDLLIMKDLMHLYIANIRVEKIEGKPSHLFKKVTIETINEKKNDAFVSDLREAGLDFIVDNTFYVDSRLKRVFYDPEMTNEVPFVYMERVKRKREHTTSNGKRVSVWVQPKASDNK